MNDEFRDTVERLTALTRSSMAGVLRHWELGDPVIGGRWVHFLGTGGNPVNLLTQYRQTGGFVLHLGRLTMAVDPGPGFIYHASRQGIHLPSLDAVFVSHGHTDHCSDAGAAIEGMCRVMSERRGLVLAPREVYDEGAVTSFHQGLGAASTGYPGGPECLALKDGHDIELPDAVLTPVTAYHAKENYGFVIRDGEGSLGYTSDTAYVLSYRATDGSIRNVQGHGPMEGFARVEQFRETTARAFAKVAVLIANVSYFNLYADRHVTALGLVHLLKQTQARLCIMTHLDPCCFRPVDFSSEMVEFVQAQSGVRTIIAADNCRYQL